MTSLLAGLAELENLTELDDLTELLAGLTELLDFTEALELLTAGLLELFRVGSTTGSLKELLDLAETLALLVELAFFDEEDELNFLLLEGATGALLEDDEAGFLLEDDEVGFLLEEEDFVDAEEVFLLEATGLTVDFLTLAEEEEAVLGKLVNFERLERVRCLVETGSTIVEAFFELLLATFALLVAFFELELDTLALLEDFLELLEDFAIGEPLGMEKVVVGLTEETLAVEDDSFLDEVACPERSGSTEAEIPTVIPMPSRGSLAARSTFSSLLSLEFKGAARMMAGARRPKIAA